jgi:CYTH domain-containing protein
MQEIERKFLVKNQDFQNEVAEKIEIEQGYLNLDPNKTIRIRIKNQKGVLTIKGKSSADGMQRFEWETAVDLGEAKALLNLCEKKHILTKTRFIIPFENHTWEVDVFDGVNQGLLIAEIELSSRDEEFKKPDWCGEEVTGDKRYYNLQLAQKPFKGWKK